MVAWAQAGVQIPRTTYDDWASLPHVATADMQPGDLMLFDGEGHVGMYVGNGMLVDAPQPGQTVEEIPDHHVLVRPDLRRRRPAVARPCRAEARRRPTGVRTGLPRPPAG